MSEAEPRLSESEIHQTLGCVQGIGYWLFMMGAVCGHWTENCLFFSTLYKFLSILGSVKKIIDVMRHRVRAKSFKFLPKFHNRIHACLFLSSDR